MPSGISTSPTAKVSVLSSADAVSRVSTNPKATAFTFTLNGPHSLASVFVMPDERRLAGRVVDLADVPLGTRDRGHVDDLAEHLAPLLALLLRRLAQVGGGSSEHPEGATVWISSIARNCSSDILCAIPSHV